MKRLNRIILALCLSANSFAGVNGLTHHSRANCINNETISWHLGHKYWFVVKSYHYNQYTGELIHYIKMNWELTWRAAAVHWGEGSSGWKVRGEHWMLGTDHRAYLMCEEVVTDCSIYDGWWDYN